MVPPDPGNLVEQWLLRVRVLENIGDRKIGNYVSVGQGRKSDRYAEKLCRRGVAPEVHQGQIPPIGANHRHNRLGQGHEQGRDQSEVTKLGYQIPVPIIPFRSFGALAFPLARFLQGVRHFARHVSLVVFSKNLARLEYPFDEAPP